jgi:hypothetical protein
MNLSRNALLVKFFAQVYRGIPRKHLVKLIYEADVLAREYLSRPLSTFVYRRDKYGPYDPAIKEAVAELVSAGHVEEKHDRWLGSEWSEGEYIRLFDQHHPVSFGFDLGESAVLDYVVRNYVNMPFQEFLEGVVYETIPMKNAGPKGSPLPMELANGIGTRKVGFHLAEVLAAEEAGRRGEFVTLSAFVAELQDQAPA